MMAVTVDRALAFPFRLLCVPWGGRWEELLVDLSSSETTERRLNLTRSADTAVVMRAYGPLTRPPHTSSMAEKHTPSEQKQLRQPPQ